MRIEPAVNFTLGSILFLTAGLIFWPLTVGIVVATVVYSWLEGRWWASPLAFLLAMTIGSALAVWSGYPV